MATIEKGRITESATEARAGERGPSVRNVLFVSLAGVVVAFALIYVFFFST